MWVTVYFEQDLVKLCFRIKITTFGKIHSAIFIRSTLLKKYADCTLLKTYSDACSISRLLKAYAYC